MISFKNCCMFAKLLSNLDSNKRILKIKTEERRGIFKAEQ